MATKKGRAKSPARRSPRRPQPKPLSTEAKNRLRKPLLNAEELLQRAASALQINRRKVATFVRPNQLTRAKALFDRAQERESKVKAANEARLRPLADARLIAGDSAQRMLDELKEAIANSSRKYPELQGAFRFLFDAYARKPRPPDVTDATDAAERAPLPQPA